MEDAREDEVTIGRNRPVQVRQAQRWVSSDHSAQADKANEVNTPVRQ